MVIFFLENEVLEFREKMWEREREREAGLNIVLKHMENTNEEKWQEYVRDNSIDKHGSILEVYFNNERS